jgi:alpha/beta hydrolase fold
MGMGYTQTPEGQTISPATQAEMLALLLDALHIDRVDLVANDSGGLVAQLFLAKYPQRVRTLLLTNCDADENSPPPQFLPLIELAKQGTLVEKFIVPLLKDKELARSAKGMGGLAYTHPESLTDEMIETYFRPLVETPLRRAQLQRHTVSMETNPLVAIREELRRWKGPARMVWGLKDTLSGWSGPSGWIGRCRARAACDAWKERTCFFRRRSPTSSPKRRWLCGTLRRSTCHDAQAYPSLRAIRRMCWRPGRVRAVLRGTSRASCRRLRAGWRRLRRAAAIADGVRRHTGRRRWRRPDR